MGWEGLSSEERLAAYGKLVPRDPADPRMRELRDEARKCVEKLEQLAAQMEKEFPPPDNMRWHFHLFRDGIWMLHSIVVEDDDSAWGDES